MAERQRLDPRAVLDGMLRLSPGRQVQLMAAFAAAVALVVGTLLWARTPTWGVLYAGLEERDAGQVLAALEQAGIAHRVEPGSGVLQVPAREVHAARLRLAAQGLPGTAGALGIELLDKAPRFGESRALENLRRQHALEVELARTIGALDGVRAVRVHLALPETASYARPGPEPSASVMVTLGAGRTLDAGQVAAVVHLVAGSVPRLPAARVTVVDQAGTLLSQDRPTDALAQRADQFAHQQRIEQAYTQRIEDLLAPLVGPGGVRARVSAEVDFARTEQTEERYNPAGGVVRSEERSSDALAAAGGYGVPGSLSNIPPVVAATPPAAPATPQADGDPAPVAATPPDAAAPLVPASAPPAAAPRSERSLRNYEIDRTVRHTQLPSGQVRRLSVAVLVDERRVTGADGAVTRAARTAEELERMRALVSEAVGMDAARGDRVSVHSAPFEALAPAEEPAAPAWWSDARLWDGLRALGALALAAAVLFGLLRPVLRGLTEAARAAPPRPPAQALAFGAGAPAAPLPAPAAAPVRLEAPPDPRAIEQDPRRIAATVRDWMGADA